MKRPLSLAAVLLSATLSGTALAGDGISNYLYNSPVGEMHQYDLRGTCGNCGRRDDRPVSYRYDRGDRDHYRRQPRHAHGAGIRNTIQDSTIGAMNQYDYRQTHVYNRPTMLIPAES